MLQYNNLVNCLQSLLGVLELDRRSQLYQETVAICNYLQNPVYRIAVFAPFNYGKSTLLNALLGSKTLPIDLIPTTGAAISVGYGSDLATKITLQNGSEIVAPGVKILQEYAVLDGDRRMKSSVAEVKVFCAHPWLKTGVEFLDLPGTNDREAQNELVKDKLLSADLILHVLDARQLMTLEERENLTNWLSKRGIKTVVFVVNFLNLLTEAEQKEVKTRLRFVAESFRSNLPSGISNLYCVDALPALRARLKGNLATAQTTGLTTFEAALQHIVNAKQESAELSRVVKLGEQLQAELTAKQQSLEAEMATQTHQGDKQTAVKQKAEKLIQQSFNRSLSDLRGWLYLPKLLTTYQASLAIALQQGEFNTWLSNFQAEISDRRESINKWIAQGCEFFAYSQPQLLIIDLPAPPTIEISASAANEIRENAPAKSALSKELNFMLKSKVGAVVLGGASYVLNKVSSGATTVDSQENEATKISSQVYADAAAAYLQKFSDRTNLTLDRYETIAQIYITFTPGKITRKNSHLSYQLELIKGLAHNFETELTKFNYQ